MSKPLPILSQMPWHIQKDIIDAANVETKFSVRQCSKQLKNTVDNSKMPLDSLSFSWKWDSTLCEEMITVGHCLEGKASLVFFSSSPDGFSRKVFDGSEQDIQQFVENGDYADAGIEQFMKVLRRFPKLKIDRMAIEFRRYTTDLEGFESRKRIVEQKLNGALSNLNRQLLVRNLKITSNDNADGVSQLLSHFRPGTLEKIAFSPCALSTKFRSVVEPMNLKEVAELEQWKQARVLFLYKFVLDLPLEKTAHFNSIDCHSSAVTLESVLHILDKTLCKNGWTARKTLTTRLEYDALTQYFSRFESPKTPGFYDGRTFKVSRGDFECQLFIANNKKRVSVTRSLQA